MSNDDNVHLIPGDQLLAVIPDEKSAYSKTPTNYRRMLDVCRAVKKSELNVSCIQMHPDGRIEVCPVVHDSGKLSDDHSDDAARIEKAFAR